MIRNLENQNLFEQMSNHNVYLWFSLGFLQQLGYSFYEKMDDFSSQLGMIKCSEIRHFSMKFPSEGEFWHCHFAGNKLGASNQVFQA